MIRRLVSRARQLLPSSAAKPAKLQAEIDELRGDINELRMDNLRIAQLHDIVVDRLAELQRATKDEGTPNVER